MDDNADSFGGATPAGSDPFADLLNAPAASTPTPIPAPAPEETQPTAQGPDPFADLLEAPESSQTSFGGAALRGAERSVLPAAGGLVGAGAGAEAGGAAGAVVGAAIGAPFAGIGAAPGAAAGAVVGSVIGGVAGAFGGSMVTEKAQDFGLHALPSEWVDKLGQSDRQQQIDQEYQGTASFLGGLVPYVVTLHPNLGGAAAALPENATAMQRILAHPLTARVFGGAAMGGMEAGQELAQGQKPSWTNIAISTGFGMVFNKPTRIGEALTETGAAPVRRVLGLPEPVAVAPVPTVAQAGDTKVMGPGITEDVFMGSHEQAPDAAMAAQDTARTETSLIGPETPGPDLHAVARQLEPETFQQYDALSAQRDDLRAHLAALASPADEDIQAATAQRDALQTQLDEHLAARGGYAGGPEARAMRAQVRDAQSQVDQLAARREAFTMGQGVDTPEMTALRQQIMQTDSAMRDLAPQVAAANRRAADRVGAGIVEPVSRDTTPEVAPVAPTLAETATVAPGGPVAASVQEQADAIAADVTRRLVAAGRPADEAQASGRLIASHYQARAARFGGTLGTPLELYQAHGPLIRGFGANAKVVAPAAKPPLMPTTEAPNFPPRTVAQPSVATAVPEGARVPVQTPVANNGIEALDPRSIGVDARRFQFKEGGDESGVTERLQGVEKWDPRLAGTALVWRDETGKNWIADGHQRLALANRLSEGQPDIRLNAFVLNSADGITDEGARAIAAAKNIAEGTGTAIDAAKIIRIAKDKGQDLPPLPPRSALVRDGKALAELSPDAFGMVVNEVVPAAQGAMVGRLVKDPLAQVEAIRLLTLAKPENAQQAEMIVRDMLGSGTEQMTRQDSLFGEEAFASSIVLERAKIADEAIKQLRKDKATFATLVKEADRIQGAGENVLDQAANTSRLTTDEKASDLLTQLAFRAGPVSDALSAVARRLKSGDIKPAEAAREFLGVVRSAVESGVDTGADVGRPEPGAAGQRQELATEPGAEGLPQTLLPGVAPITDLERANLEASKPLQGGNAAPGGLFDEDAQNQRSLFQTAPAPDTPEFENWFGDSKVVDEEGQPKVVYHGSSRSDRIAERGKFDKKRATSGPMAFFTDDPDIASSYATKKQDTSLPDEEHLAQRFILKPDGYRGKPRRIDEMWWALQPEERDRITKLAPRVTMEEDGDGSSHILLAPEGHTTGIGNYDYEVKQARGNQLKALAESWLHSGQIFGDEEKFLDVLKAAGLTSKVEYHDPMQQAGGVFPVYLAIQNPLDASVIPESVVDALKEAGKGKRAPKYSTGKDLWDKTVQDPKEWIARLVEDTATGKSSYAWSSIPDWVTDTLRRLGYDGIKDIGGKLGGQDHTVWIPFEETQVKSTANRGTFDPSDARILYQRDLAETYGKDGQLAFDLTGDARNIVGKPQETIEQMQARIEALTKRAPYSEHEIDPERPATPANNPEIRSIYRTIDGHTVQFGDEYQAELYSLGDALNAVDGKMGPGVEDEAHRLLGVIGPFLDPPARTVADLTAAARSIADSEHEEASGDRPTPSMIDTDLSPKWHEFIARELRDRLGERVLFQPAYHGTPHIFDKFSTDKIGTGEGAQAYGHGLYFASRKGVAEHYRETLAGRPKGGGFRLDGTVFTSNTIPPDAPTFFKTPEAATAIRNRDEARLRAGADTAASDLRARALDQEKAATDQETGKILASTYTPAERREKAASFRRQADATDAFGKRITFEKGVQPGRLYHVDVPEAHELLDWDKRLSEQPEGVKEKLAGLGFSSAPVTDTQIDSWPVEQWMWRLRDDGKLPPGTTISDRIKPMEQALARHGGNVEAASKDYLDGREAERTANNSNPNSPLVSASRAADQTIVDELRKAEVTHGPIKAPDPAEEIDDPALAGIVKDALAINPDPGKLVDTIANDPDLTKRDEAWALSQTGWEPRSALARGPGYATEEATSEFLYHQSIYREQLGKGASEKPGQDIYQQLGARLATDGNNMRFSGESDHTYADRLASEALKNSGIPGHQYVGHESQSTNYVIYDDSRVPITNYEQGKRGSITFAPGKKPIIKLFQDANASTFIHETGHQWLEELMADAKHPAANDSLRNDAQTVSDWLGMEEAWAPIKTAQHEKFARGFEQYLREGVAPSPELASVFARFKDWLTQIYQSIKGLGTPINEDIRGVFDRLLEEEPNRTVIAPEREGAQSLASLHELDALHAHPAEAEPIGDRIAAERDAYVAQQHPEILNELARAEAERAVAAAEPAGESTSGAAGSPEVGGLGGNANAEPAGGGGSGERSTVQPGGGPSMGESTGLPNGTGPAAGSAAEPGLRLERPEPAGGARAQPLAPDAGHLFGPEQSPFVDLAGNVRIENLTSSADVAQAIHDAADANNDFIGDRRGVITDGQVMDLADALGMDAAQLSTRRLGQSFNAEQIIAARKLLIQSATDVSALMKKAAVGTDEDVMAYAMAKDRHQMIQGQVAGITAEAGRALRAFRNIAGHETAQGVDQFLRSATGKTLFQLREEAKLGATLDTPAKVSKFVNDARHRTFGQMILEYWINGLISGPATHTTYVVGNTILALEKAGPETAAAAMIGKLRTMLGREGPTVRMGEVGAQLRGAASALPMATKAAIDSLRTGVTTRLPGETAKSLPFQPGTEFAPSAMIDESMGYADIAPQVFGMVRGIRDGLISAGSLVSAGGVKGAPMIGLRYSPLGAIPDVALRGLPVLPLGTAARLPSRFVAAIHSFYRATIYSMTKNALAYRSAAESGKTGEAFDAHVADVRQNPTPEIMEQSRSTATDLALMGKGSEFVQALSRLTNAKILGFPILKFVDPFVHIAGNILDQSIVQRTPVGILSPSLREDLMGRNGTIAQDTAQGRMLVGTMLSIGFGSLAAEGLMSGSGPSDPNQSAMWRLAGNQAHSIRIGDVWYDVHRLGPMGMLAGVAADMYDVAHAAQSGDMLQAASLLQHAFTQNILDESFMSGPAQLIQALEDPGRYGQSYIRNFLSSFVPYSVGMGQLAKASDPYSRQARGFMDAVKNKVPGLSESLMLRRDIWGNEIPNLNAVGGRALSAIYMQPVGHDPVNLAMLDLGIYPAAVEKKIRGVLLTDQQYDTYARLAGRMAKMRLDTIINSPDFQRWPPSTRVSVIDETIRQSRETARGMIMAANPSIVVQATQQKLAKLQ